MVKLENGANSLRTVASETLWNLSHLKRSIDQKKSIDPFEGQDWLDRFYEGLDGKTPFLGRRIAAGFWFTVYAFEADNQKKVFKIGHKFKPSFGQFDPSSKDYFNHYKENLAIQTEIYQPHLPYLILPQEVGFVQSERRGATVIAEPYIAHRQKVADFRALTPQQQQAIIEEYDIFIALTKTMRKKGKLQPDFVFEKIVRHNNLIIAQMQDGNPHLVLVDNGAIDLTLGAPILNTLATATATFWPTFERTRFENIHKRNGNHHY